MPQRFARKRTPKRAANENERPQHCRQTRPTLEQPGETAAAAGTVEAPEVVSGRAMAGEAAATVLDAVPELAVADAAVSVATGWGAVAVEDVAEEEDVVDGDDTEAVVCVPHPIFFYKAMLLLAKQNAYR